MCLWCFHQNVFALFPVQCKIQNSFALFFKPDQFQLPPSKVTEVAISIQNLTSSDQQATWLYKESSGPHIMGVIAQIFQVHKSTVGSNKIFCTFQASIAHMQLYVNMNMCWFLGLKIWQNYHYFLMNGFPKTHTN